MTSTYSTENIFVTKTRNIPNLVARKMRRVAVDEILKRFGNLKEEEVQTKSSETDFVTLADTEAERVLTDVLPSLLPDSLVFGEEAVSRNPALLEYLNSEQLVWILDPLDGTFYFRNSQDGFTMLVTLARKGIPVMGFALKPNLNTIINAKRQEVYDANKQDVYMAVLGKETYLNKFGDPKNRIVIPASSKDPSGWRIAWTRRNEGETKADRNPPQLIGTCYLSMGIGGEFIKLLTGEIDAISYDRCYITPWDFAANYLLITEAGGCWLQNRPGPYRAAKDDTLRFVAARNEATAHRVWAALYPDAPEPYNARNVTGSNLRNASL